MKQTPLKRDPEKVRAFNDRARGSLSRGPLDGFAPRRAPLRRSRPKGRMTIPPETRLEVRKRSGGKCVACIYEGRAMPSKIDQRHHVLPVQKWPELEPVADNMVGVCWRHHAAHESAPDYRIPLLALPQCCFELAAVVGQDAVDYLLEIYAQEA